MPYFLIIALQAFCIYHAYKNKNSYYWFFAIIFLPILGSLIYLVTQVFNKRDLDVVKNEITTIINPTKKVNDLQKKLDFADTFQNRVNLADALHESGNHKGAIEQYEKALSDDGHKDLSPIKNMIAAYYQVEDYKNVIFYAEKVTSKPDFKGSTTQFLYGLALEKEGQSEKAEENLRAMDKRYSHYEERYALAQFLIEKGKPEDAKEILSEIILESEHMSRPNRRNYGAVIAEVEKLISTL